MSQEVIDDAIYIRFFFSIDALQEKCRQILKCVSHTISKCHPLTRLCYTLCWWAHTHRPCYIVSAKNVITLKHKFFCTFIIFIFWTLSKTYITSSPETLKALRHLVHNSIQNKNLYSTTAWHNTRNVVFIFEWCMEGAWGR